MAPDPAKQSVSFPQMKYPPLRDSTHKTPYQWIISKQMEDGAEGLWRIHDSLYDFTDFIASHPGGVDWLNNTKGTDITEAFETHHLHGVPETLHSTYFVRKAQSSRNSPFTFEDDGFYRTLKAKVSRKLKELPSDTRRKSNNITDVLLITLIMSSPLCCWLWTQNLILGAASTLFVGFIISAVSSCAHNYFHRSDSWRMYLFNISGLNYKEWRISHVLSHHLYTNTFYDLELSALEPFLQYLPYTNKSIWARMGALYYPVFFPFVSIVCLIREIAASVLKIGGKTLDWLNIIPFLLPIWMWLASGVFLPWTIAVWIALLLISSFLLTVYGLTAGHHGHTNFFEGDVPREEYLDWGLHQMDTIVEQIGNAGNHFKSITRFGDHILHHLFPTLDHGELQYLYPILFEHCEKYETQFRTNTLYGAFISQSKQLTRIKPNNFRIKDAAIKIDNEKKCKVK